MPFKSQAQRRLFWAKSNQGEIPEETVREWEHATKHKSALPEHVAKKAYVQGSRAVLHKLGFIENIDPEELPEPLATRKKKFLRRQYRLNAATGMPAGGLIESV